MCKIKYFFCKIFYYFIFLLIINITVFSTAYAYIITSIRPLAFIVAGIVDDITDVQILIPDGLSPHDYSLKPSDLKKNQTV